MNNSLDPNAPASSDSGIFGLDNTEEDSRIVLLPVPWDATTSYGRGTAMGPKAMLKASHQIDLFDSDVLRPYEAGICLLPENGQVISWAALAAQAVNATQEEGLPESYPLREAFRAVNDLSSQLAQYISDECNRLWGDGKIVGIVGGEHSVPFGAIRALSERSSGFGILQIDAHSDTRRAYQGFTHSHASIAYNLLENAAQLQKLVQVGVRDYCDEEFDYIVQHQGRLRVFFDSELARRSLNGDSWANIATDIVDQLPQDVWITFDIDGLDPSLCPNTGTPVPGGLQFREAVYLLRRVVESGRKIVGFDLCEVAPGNDEWDANVGSRILYKLCAFALASQGLRELR